MQKINVFPSSVIMSVLSAATGRLLTEQNSHLVCYVLAKPFHPSNLTNHCYPGFVKLPLNGMGVKERLEACKKENKQLK